MKFSVQYYQSKTHFVMFVGHGGANGSLVFCAWVILLQDVSSSQIVSVSNLFFRVVLQFLVQQLHLLTYSEWFLDLSEILGENQMGSQGRRKGTKTGKCAVALPCIYLHSPLLLTALQKSCNARPYQQ